MEKPMKMQETPGQMMFEFICAHCGNGDHYHCEGGSWCDCQHVIRKSDGYKPEIPVPGQDQRQL